MKKALIAFGMLLMAAPAYADLTHKIQSSVQLNVNSAATQATRIGNSYSISGNNVTTSDGCLLYTSPSPRDKRQSRMPSSA